MESIGGTRVTTKEDRRVDRAEFDFHADLLPPILDQRLKVLTDGVDRGLVDNGQRNAIFFADTITIGVNDTGIIQHLVGSIDVLHVAAFDVDGKCRRCGHPRARNAASLAIANLNQQRTVDGHRHCLVDGRVRQERMRTDHRPLIRAKRRIGVGVVQHDAFQQRAKACDRHTLAAFFHLGDDVGGQLQVPSVVEFAGFHHGRTSRRSRAAALQGQAGKGGFCRIAVVGVGDHGDHVVRLELGDNKRAGANGVEVLFGAGRGRRAGTALKLGLLQDRAFVADKGTIGVRGRHVEYDHDGQVIRCLNRCHAFEFGQLRTATFGVGAVFVSEFHICRSNGRTIRPQQPWCELPCDLCQILAYAAICDGGNLVDQPGNQRAGFIVAGQRFDNQRGGFGVFCAAGQERVQNRRSLPIQDLDLAVRGALGKGGGGQRHCSSGPKQ